MLLASICYLVAHPNPANHFAEFTEQATVIAGEMVGGKFERKALTIDPEKELAPQVGELFTEQKIVICDIANEKWADFYQWLAVEHPEVKRAIYHDNPEGYVPSEYSKLAERIISQSHVGAAARASASV